MFLFCGQVLFGNKVPPKGPTLTEVLIINSIQTLLLKGLNPKERFLLGKSCFAYY